MTVFGGKSENQREHILENTFIDLDFWLFWREHISDAVFLLYNRACLGFYLAKTKVWQ